MSLKEILRLFGSLKEVEVSGFREAKCAECGAHLSGTRFKLCQRCNMRRIAELGREALKARRRRREHKSE
jgi:hypothetical protein